MQIYEIYRSIQGESSYAGQPCTFVRTAGCSLRCVYCDTDYALPHDSGKELPISQIIDEVKKRGDDLVEITGGEPMEQPDTPELCRQLLYIGSKVLLETGGHISLQSLPKNVIKILDIKTPGSRMLRKYHWENMQYLQPHDEIKFVVCDREDFDWAVKICDEYQLFGRHIIHFSPRFGVVSPSDLSDWILNGKIPVRLQLQTHKYIWDPQKRGV